jgi:hypothetical protein
MEGNGNQAKYNISAMDDAWKYRYSSVRLLRVRRYKMKPFVTCTLLLVVSMCAEAQSSGNASQAAPFTITISTGSPAPRLGGPVLIHINLRSTSQKEFVLPEKRHSGQEGELNYRLILSGPHGEAISDSEYGGKVKAGKLVRGYVSGVLKTMNLGDQVEEDVDLNRLFQLKDPGTYTVRVERNDPKFASMKIGSNRLQVNITD